jgi:hypothetical protein
MELTNNNSVEVNRTADSQQKQQETGMKAKRSFLLASIVAAVLLSGHTFASEGLMKDFVLFDRVFIPPLALTGQEKCELSKNAMEPLKAQWAQFKTNHYEAKPKDPRWKQDLDSVESKIIKAEQIILGEKNLMGAHEILETIRFALRAARTRNGIDYYIDYLSEFHEHMEAILHMATERDGGSFSDNDLHFLAGECEEAVRIWVRLQNLPFEKELFGFSDRMEAGRKELLEKEAQALYRLRKALETDDKMLIIKSSKEIGRYYAQLYMLFGDFQRFGDPR